ncbi:DJ-1/PfpI family protein [Stigmatella sp. ncwal1]|uniref:DJ-1/PfpI family protein n=1 Tax=Stigmatella ashevillensis TaxID=2995309 RepID=A0ABT5D6S3_9BACT|nr:DJ-1/PfpI family protein [Stigmatella ashevillena]MDC0709364.1 DJ-1/PfpI family protein [Stigmatella ashevillena]
MASSPVIVFPLYPQVTFLDFIGPQSALQMLPGAKLVFASVGAKPISEGALTLTSLTRLEDLERCDVLCVPGGLCVEPMEDAVYLAAIRRLASTARYVTSVCTGSLILGMAGLLEGRRAACHWAMRDLLASFGAIPDSGRVVRDGNILTGGGVTAGVDFGLTLAAELAGPVVAQSIQLMLEYAPEPPFNAGRPDTAPKEILDFVQNQGPLDIKAGLAALQGVAAGYRVGRDGYALPTGGLSS